MKPQDDISINPGATYPNLNNLDGSPFFAWRQYKHADEITEEVAVVRGVIPAYPVVRSGW